MTETLQQKIEFAAQKRDLARLVQLHQALTENRSFSHYAAMPYVEAAGAAEMAEAAIARLTPTPRKKRTRVKNESAELDLTYVYEPDLFADATRWPRKPYCTLDPEAGLSIRSLQSAIWMPYLQPNPPHLRAWAAFDIDRPDAATAWQTAGLPPPTWTAINRENGHAHSVWGLNAPVLIDGLGARHAPMRYLASIEAMMREKLNADAGYSGLITKNPGHTKWDTWRGPQLFYDLSELAGYLPGIEKYRPTKKEEQSGLGRNVSLFDALRKWAYKSIRGYWGGGLSGWNAWLSSCNNHALTMNANLFSMNMLGGKEVWHIARSVAKWTWRNFSSSDFSAYQSRAGAKGGAASGRARAEASEEKRAKAHILKDRGMTQAAIAIELGVTDRTVRNLLSKT